MKRAFALFDEMTQIDIAPNAHTYGALISGVCKAGQMEAAEILLEEMQS
ncbi:pentatricopeptide repeat-containing protein, partial [Trifolium medium]|nr:pentatricopeptide repeat-containing protein [Trifolium medium]